jgi:hypothetical protein
MCNQVLYQTNNVYFKHINDTGIKLLNITITITVYSYNVPA